LAPKSRRQPAVGTSWPGLDDESLLPQQCWKGLAGDRRAPELGAILAHYGQHQVWIEFLHRRADHWAIVERERATGRLRGTGGRVKVLVTELSGEILHQLVESGHFEELEVALDGAPQGLDVRVQCFARPNAPVDAVTVVVGLPRALGQQVVRNRRLGAPVTDNDKRRRVEQREDQLYQLRIELLYLLDQVTVGVLLRLPVEPNDLGAAVDAEFPEIIRAAVDLGDVADVRAALIQRHGQADVEVGRQHRAHEAAHDELGEPFVARADPIGRLQEVEKKARAVFARIEQVLNDKRKVLREAILALDEPRVGLKPCLPLGELDLLWEDRTALHLLGEDAPSESADALRSQRDTGGK
jgi:hypothetical protein